MLVLECKGYGVKRSSRGTWTRVNHDGTEKPLKKDPFDQAQGHIKDLAAELRPRMEAAFPHVKRFPFAYGHAVIFPMAVLGDVNLPLNIPSEIVFDSTDLEHLGDRVRECMTYWQRFVRKPPPLLEPHEFKRFRKHILQPKLELVPCLGAAVRAEAQTLHRLTEQQLLVVESWLDNTRLRVKGCAGSGKTVLAMEAARQLSHEGKRTLILCYNRQLGEFLRGQTERWDLEEGQVHVGHFHRLCMHAFHLVDGKQPVIPDDAVGQAAFWDDAAPMAVLRAIESGSLQPFDAVIVDEGQDFERSWWAVIDELLADPEESRLLVFYDPSQEIFGRKVSVPTAPTIKLTCNLRNTQKIADVVQELGGSRTRRCEHCPEGTPPVVHQQQGPARTRRDLDALVKSLVQKERLLPEQIVVLTPHTRKNSSLAGLEELGGFPLMSHPFEQPGAVLHTTIGAFKGLEADAIILVDVDPEDERCTRQARYVAASRARYLLHVFAKGNWMAE
jgi:hypothetical protein